MTGKVLVVDAEHQRWREELSTRVPAARVIGANSVAEAADLLAETEVLVSMCLDLTPEAVVRMPQLVWVQSLISGYEHLRRTLAGRDDLIVTTARGIHGPQMAETALFHMLCAARDGRRVFEQQARRHWQAWEPSTLAGRTVTIIGLGAAGRTLAPICHALGMTVLGVTRGGRPIIGVDSIFPREQLHDALSPADFVVLMAPAEPDGKPLLGAAELGLLKPSSSVINLGRGSLIDEAALDARLSADRIAWAGLDVFEQEPLPASSPLWDRANVVVTPHIAGHNDRYIEQAMTVVAPNLERYLAGDPDAMVNRVTL